MTILDADGNDASERREDGWSDRDRGFGGSGPARYHALRAQLVDLSDLYDTNWLARKIVDGFPEHAFKGGFSFADPTLLSDFNKANADPLHPEGHLRRALSMGRLHAGAILVVLPERGDNTKLPWRPGDGYRHVMVERYSDVSITFNVDPNSPLVNQPEIIKLSLHPFAGLEVHASRCIMCEGSGRAKPTKEIPWCSTLDPCFDVLADYGFSWAAVSQLIKEASIMWVKMDGLIKGLSMGKADDSIQGRLKFANRTKSVNNTLFLDLTEEAGRVAVSFADLPSLMQELSLQICGATGYPATRLLGRSPAGMNATGASDEQNFNSNVEAYRDLSVRPKISRFCELTASVKPSVVTFGSLSTPTPLESEQLRKARFEADKILWEMDALDSLQIIHARIKDGTLGVQLPLDLVAQIELAIKNPKKQNTLDIPITDVPFFTTVNEARESRGMAADPINGKRLVAEVRAELESSKTNADPSFP